MDIPAPPKSSEKFIPIKPISDIFEICSVGNKCSFLECSINSKVDGLTVRVEKIGTFKLPLIGEFPGHELDQLMEKSSNQIFWILIQFRSNFGHELDRSLENSSKIEHLVKK